MRSDGLQVISYIAPIPGAQGFQTTWHASETGHRALNFFHSNCASGLKIIEQSSPVLQYRQVRFHLPFSIP